MKKLAFVASFAVVLVACAGEEISAPSSSPSSSSESPSTTSNPASSSETTTTPAPSPARESLAIANDIDDPSLASYCAESTRVPTRGAFQADPYFALEGAVDLSAVSTDKGVDLAFRWPSKLSTDAAGAPMRSERYVHLSLELATNAPIGTSISTHFALGGGGYDCSRTGFAGGDAAGGDPTDAASVTLTARTATTIEGTADVPTRDGAGLAHLEFQAPIVPADVKANDKLVCCLK